ncbi:MAG: hypothetical protein QXO57_02555 [Candidatus Aenigmatarchaeota archaeon]
MAIDVPITLMQGTIVFLSGLLWVAVVIGLIQDISKIVKVVKEMLSE